MKYDPEKSFGYPVLSVHKDDYLRAAFELTVDFDLKKDDPKKFHIDYTFDCGVREMRELIEQGGAAYWIKIASRSTFYSEMFESLNVKGEIDLDGEKLRDVVEISAFIVGKKETRFRCDRINPEFGYNSFDIFNGQVLAQSVPRLYSVDKEFWKPISSIFEYMQDDQLKDGEYFVDLDAEFVQIFANQKQCQYFKDFEKTKEGKTVLLNTVFFSAVAKMIEVMNDRPDDYGEKKWARVLKAKAAAKNIKLDEAKMLLSTHRILDRPLRSLTTSQLFDR